LKSSLLLRKESFLALDSGFLFQNSGITVVFGGLREKEGSKRTGDLLLRSEPLDEPHRISDDVVRFLACIRAGYEITSSVTEGDYVFEAFFLLQFCLCS